MEIIKASIKNEISKMFSLKKYKLLLLIISIISISSGVLGKVAKGFIGFSFGNGPLTMLSIATAIILPLIISMAAADLFTAEQENGSIKAIITRPISRISIFISKIIAIFLYIILSLLICLMASLISSSVFNGIGVSSIMETFIAYTVSIIPMLPIVLFAVTISQFCKSSSSTVMLSILGYMAIVIVSTAIPSINPMIFTSYTGWYKLFIGAAMPFTRILNVTTLLIAYSLILFAISSWAFEKREY